MNSLNSGILEGNVVRKPELRQTPKGTPVAKVGVAVHRWYRSNEELVKEVSFFNVDAWGALANLCAEKCDQGRGIRVVGRLKQERWVDQEGKNRSTVTVVAEHVEFRPPRTDAAQGAADQSAAKSKAELADLADAAIATAREEGVF
jgi:single-strand DNA-binding protein